MVVSILVLEKALGIQSLSVDKEHELLLDSGNVLGVSLVWHLLAVEGLGSGVIEGNINRSFKVLFGENLINSVTEFSPFNMASSLWCLEFFSEKFEFCS